VFGPQRPGLTSNPETGEVERNVVSHLAARTVGLFSAAAPPEGDLVPSPSGWLIGSGPRRQQLYPVFSQWADRSLVGACLYISLVSAVGLYSVLVEVLITAAPLLALVAGIQIIPRLRLRRQLNRAQRVLSLEDAPSGTLVRVTGTIGPQATVPTLFRGVPAVLFRNRIANADETRGQDFLLDLDQGEQAKVAVRRSYLLEPPERTREPPACGPVSDRNFDGRSVLRPAQFDRRPPGSRQRRYESSVGVIASKSAASSSTFWIPPWRVARFDNFPCAPC
jgi:hypothetical protein